MDDETQSPRLTSTFAAIENAETVLSALDIFQSAYGIDHVTYHLSQTKADVFDAPFVKTTYDDKWIARYLLRGYVTIDPIVRQGFLRAMPFDWQEVEITDDAHEFLFDASRHGVGPHGFSIPVLDRTRRALLSLNSHASQENWEEIVANSRAEWLELAHVIHRKAIIELYGQTDPIPTLSPRELECLHWSALGNDAKGISVILGLSEHTTRSYLKSARFKLGCLTTTAASAKAIQFRLINPYGNTLI